jgi:15-cis-phytoene synthase
VDDIRDPQLRAAYARCRRMQRWHDPTYYWATRRLPRDVRPAVHALYGFVRGADEIVDGRNRPPTPAARRAALDAWQAELEGGLAGGRSDHPVIAALVDAGARHDLPLGELRVYMGSMRIDCGPVRMANDEELDRYMAGSAAAVGRVMAPILGAPPGLSEDMARLGLAFQLTNFIRDVREDYALDRVYLPGLPASAIARREATPGVRERVAREVERARLLFAATAGLAGDMTPSVRTGMRVARAVYERVLDHVEAIGFDVVGRRAALPRWRAGAVAGRALLTPPAPR